MKPCATLSSLWSLMKASGNAPSDPTQHLLREIAACRLCAAHLPHEPRPVVSFHSENRIAIIGQAPGRRVHESGTPWSDASGRLLRQWLGVDERCFYQSQTFAFIPMGFCFPGGGPHGDHAPRPECAPHWHPRIKDRLKQIDLTLLVGGYAQRHYLGRSAQANLTENVRRYRDYLPDFFPLPHSSPRNRIWLARNPWFESDVLPDLRHRVSRLLRGQ